MWRPVQRRLPLAWAHREVVQPIRCRSSLSINRRQLSSSSLRFPTYSQFDRSDFTSQPYTSSYETGLPTSGPLGSTPAFGAPRITPKVLKQYLDQYVVGQDRAKKVLSVAVYNHYQRVQEVQRREEEAEELLMKRQRREALEGHPLEEEFPGQPRPVGLPSTPKSRQATPLDQTELVDTSPLQLDKSNILLLGPSGVGKTLMAKTLARVLSVPFSISDCTPFTQAGYIGEDAETCVHRLLAAANYDVEQAERGIIVLDEVDKIAAAKVSHGKDVGGEGVQQALLKIIEGTTIQVQAKNEKNPRSNSPPNSYPSNSPLGNTPFQPHNNNAAAKGEVYNVRTDNILFVFSGAFVGLQKVVMDRISRGSIGFGQPVRSASSTSDYPGLPNASHNEPLPILPGSDEEALYKKHLPFFTSASPVPGGEPTYFNALDLITPADLQSYGFIPELIGRIPVTAALSTLTQPLLLRILTEPRNSLLAQYTTLFSLSGIELRFTTPALHKIAANAFTMGTGARALRTEMETILSDAMFEAPGSSVKFVLATQAVAERKEKPIYLARGQGGKFHAMISAEESEWEEKTRRDKKDKKDKANRDDGNEHSSNFQEYRKRSIG
ncbi:ATP-dependent Clp protease ATP-binding subunit clpX-like [Penicillium atrosanguineum]|uniref:ATP-dependent Clp protease ATP-binding subunit clpX-like n=1 Tax=Penicillium atrosanguineum TaxID=1132637 RepID=A0A9W9PUQ1_9EURO|nr:Multicopper oxidase type 3 [Penicillium atrosanguineum]KAJ5132993.1 ATP-dependent Clp protease ATP-binding subunit clpX-like [Penicillium atrosanguineum]KAJ5141114.1 ATP-dependent Clp protease ATP-binding subunit clpX-like [Penicillium atrosanguineum]KAJ5290662.1 Multicopper oxidase type 3 [Penicillium atrosanguineum]KAJ5308485.1 ATP-dependent Clp protease ATP-binding subunit clpX-like [Penicillium atrosanguineum]